GGRLVQPPAEGGAQLPAVSGLGMQVVEDRPEDVGPALDLSEPPLGLAPLADRPDQGGNRADEAEDEYRQDGRCGGHGPAVPADELLYPVAGGRRAGFDRLVVQEPL